MEVSQYKSKNEDRDYQHTLSSCLNPQDNGGEAILLQVDVFNNGEGDYSYTKLNTHCYGTSQVEVFLGVGIDELKEAVDALYEASKKNHTPS